MFAPKTTKCPFNITLFNKKAPEMSPTEVSSQDTTRLNIYRKLNITHHGTQNYKEITKIRNKEEPVD